jgi:protocatechuate 3,4-dioxygenase beta subunit
MFFGATPARTGLAQDGRPAAADGGGDSKHELQEVTVRVVDRDGRPVAGARIEVAGRFAEVKEAGKAGGETLSQLSDAEGIAKLRLSNDAWRCSIVAFKSGVGLDYYFIPEPAKGQKPGTWPEPVTLKLAGARTAKMKAINMAGHPIPGVVFSIENLVLPGKIRHVGQMGEPYGVALADCPSAQVVTDAEGVATFDWLPQEFVDLIHFRLMSSDYNPWHPVGFTNISLPVLTRKKPNEELLVQLVPRTTITGRVTFADGKPAKGIRVEAEGISREGEDSHGGAATTEDGTYQMSVESDRHYMVMVVDPKWASDCHENVIANAAPIADIDFRLFEGTVLHGIVSEADGQVLPKTTVLVRRLAGNAADAETRSSDGYFLPSFYRRVTTDDQGEYKLCVGPGRYRIGLPANLFENVDVDSQGDFTHDIRLQTSEAKRRAAMLHEGERSGR